MWVGVVAEVDLETLGQDRPPFDAYACSENSTHQSRSSGGLTMNVRYYTRLKELGSLLGFSWNIHIYLFFLTYDAKY
jgi:hypothetical protein